MTLQPPAHRFGKAADRVVQAVIAGNIAVCTKFPVEYLVEIFPEIPHEYFAAFAGKKSADALLLFFQVVENVREPVAKTVVTGKIVLVLRQYFMGENVFKNVASYCPEQFVLGLEVGVEGGSADVGFVDDILNGQRGIALPLQQIGERPENRRPCLALSSVHILSINPSFGTVYLFCSVSYIPTELPLEKGIVLCYSRYRTRCILLHLSYHIFNAKSRRT